MAITGKRSISFFKVAFLCEIKWAPAELHQENQKAQECPERKGKLFQKDTEAKLTFIDKIWFPPHLKISHDYCGLWPIEENKSLIPFYNHYTNNWSGQEYTVKTKTSGWVFDVEQVVYMVSKVFPQIIIWRRKIVTFEWSEVGITLDKISIPHSGAGNGHVPLDRHTEKDCSSRLLSQDYTLWNNCLVLFTNFKALQDKERLRDGSR